jgi:hypothetical protein
MVFYTLIEICLIEIVRSRDIHVIKTCNLHLSASYPPHISSLDVHYDVPGSVARA